MESVIKCTKKETDKGRGEGVSILSTVPYWPGVGGGVANGGAFGAWKWALLGLVVACAGVV